MPLIMPIKDLRNTTEISNIAHKEQEPIFITKNGYSDLVVMSSELYDKFARMNRIDQAIFESEQEIANGAEAVDAEIVLRNWRITLQSSFDKDGRQRNQSPPTETVFSISSLAILPTRSRPAYTGTPGYQYHPPESSPSLHHKEAPLTNPALASPPT